MVFSWLWGHCFLIDSNSNEACRELHPESVKYSACFLLDVVEFVYCLFYGPDFISDVVSLRRTFYLYAQLRKNLKVTLTRKTRKKEETEKKEQEGKERKEGTYCVGIVTQTLFLVVQNHLHARKHTGLAKHIGERE